MGRRSRDKGARAEREIVNLLRDKGIEARRVPLSGAARGFPDDVIVTTRKRQVWNPAGLSTRITTKKDEERFEVKARADGFKLLYRWIDDSYGLFLHADRKEWLVVMRVEDFADLVKR